jgi:hypothetical protein
MVEVRLGPQEEDESPEEMKEAVEQMYLVEVIASKVDVNYGPMTRRKAVHLAGELLYTIQGEIAIHIAPIMPWGEGE